MNLCVFIHLLIGKPVIEYISAAKAGTIFVEEMSSYQLMDLTVSPHIAVVTSFFPEHLDYHGSLEAYKDAKKHIARFQSAEDTIFYNAKSPGAIEIAEESKGQHVPFSDEDAPVQIEDTHLLGVHNLSNIAGAFKVARSLGVPVETCIQVFKDFHGLPHRLQSLGIHHDIEWIDDAISTTPESAIAALDALGDRVQTIILGGQDRGVDFKELGKRVAKSKVKTVILFPGSGPRVFEAIVEAVPQNPPSPNPIPHGGRGNEEYVHDVKKPLNDTVLYHAREMRKEPTAAEKVESASDKNKLEQTKKNLEEGKFTLKDLQAQLETMGEVGSFDKILSMVPGLGKANIPPEAMQKQQDQAKRWKHAINSMTKEEVETPEVLEKQTTRMARIAKGSGTTVSDIRALIKQYKLLKEMIGSTSGMSQNPEAAFDQKTMQKLARKFGKKMRF
jgi:hypothetical protein